MAQEWDLCIPKHTLKFFQVEIVLPQHFEDLCQVSFVILNTIAENNNVIEVDYYQLVQKQSEDLIYEHAKLCGSVTQTKRHHQEFKTTIPCHAIILYSSPYAILT